MKTQHKFGAVLLAVLVIVSGSAAGLVSVGEDTTPAAQPATAQTMVTVEDLSADEIVLEDVEVTDVRISGDETVDEAVQRSLGESGLSVEAIEMRDVSDVTIEVTDDGVTVDATIGEVHLMGVSLDEASFEASGEQATNMRSLFMGLSEHVSVGTVSAHNVSIGSVSVGGTVTMENVTMETVTVEAPGGGDEDERVAERAKA